MGVRVFHNLDEGLKDVDVIIMLRLQNERMSGALLPLGAGVFQELGLDARAARARQTGCNRDASRAR